MHEDDDDNDSSEVRRLTAFFEPEYPELPENELYVAGFKDQDGDRWGVVPLPRSMVDREVFLTNWFQPQIQADGMVRIWPMDVSEEVFKEMQETRNSLVIPLDTLIAERLDMNMDMPDYDEDGVLAAYVRQLGVRHLQLGPLAGQNRPVLAPLKLEGFASRKHQRD